jgi:ABC-type iron transport system FetAB permease component
VAAAGVEAPAGSATVAGVNWVLASVGIAFTGMAVLAYCAFRVALAVRGLASELQRTKRRLEPKQALLADELQALRRIQD